MLRKVDIISDGSPRGVKVLCGGEPVHGVTRVEIDPITAGTDFVTARLTVVLGSLQLHGVEVFVIDEEQEYD